MKNVFLIVYLISDSMVATQPIAHTAILIHAHMSELCHPLKRDLSETLRTLAKYKMLPMAN